MKRRPSFARHLVRVPLRRAPYDVVVGSDMGRAFGKTIRKIGLGPDVVIITDRNVARLYLEPLRRVLLSEGFSPLSIVIPAGERRKSLESASRIFATLLRNRKGRDCSIIALGGGVIGDLAGFVAAAYQRGVPLVHVPTTVLAQVDSSIGGKVAVNHPLGKNMIGAFYQPRLVWADISYLKTLPKREISCGLGEIIKYGVIRDRKFFGWLEDHLPEVLRLEMAALLHVQATCARIKARICGRDEKEWGERIVLNYGHTVGHALEAAGRFRTVKHGEGVLLGMKAEAWLARALGLLRPGEYDRITGLIDRVPLSIRTGALRLNELYGAIQRDKKSRSGEIRFVLPVRVGAVRVAEGPDKRLVRASVRSILR